MRAVGTLLAERWDEVHPRAEGGDFAARMAALESVDALPTVVMPLQFSPLIDHRRFGPISYRSYMLATAEVPAREGEESIDLASVDKALIETELPTLVERRHAAHRAQCRDHPDPEDLAGERRRRERRQPGEAADRRRQDRRVPGQGGGEARSERGARRSRTGAIRGWRRPGGRSGGCGRTDHFCHGGRGSFIGRGELFQPVRAVEPGAPARRPGQATGGKIIPRGDADPGPERGRSRHDQYRQRPVLRSPGSAALAVLAGRRLRDRAKPRTSPASRNPPKRRVPAYRRMPRRATATPRPPPASKRAPAPRRWLCLTRSVPISAPPNPPARSPT